MSVLGVVINWNRPQNVPVVVESLIHQCDRVVVVDNSVDPMVVGGEYWRNEKPIAEYWGIEKNHGPPVRWLAAALATERFVLFCDDDLAPKAESVDRLRSFMEDNPSCGIACDHARILPNKGAYSFREVMRPGEVQRVSVSCRMHFMRVDLMASVFWMRQLMLDACADERERSLVGIHDDLIMAAAMHWSNRRIFSIGVETFDLNCEPDDGLSDRKFHMKERRDVVRIAERVGVCFQV